MKPKIIDQDLIDLTEHGPIDDISPGGYFDYSQNLGNLLTEIQESYPLSKKRTKFKVLVSSIYYTGSREWPQPHRYEKEKIYTLQKLLKRYKQIEGEDFDVEEFDRKLQMIRRFHEKQGEKRSGWGLFTNYQVTQGKIREEREYQKNLERAQSNEDCLHIIEEHKQHYRSPVLYVA